MPEAVWMIDDGTLQSMAEKLQDKFPEKLGEIDLQKVMFVRVRGMKSNWAGKCFYVRPPWNLLTQAFNLFGGDISEPLDIRYIVAINDDLVRGIFILPEKEAMVILHEMLHIKEGMEGLVSHDIEDFAWMLNEFGIDWTQNNSDELVEQFSDCVESPPEGMA